MESPFMGVGLILVLLCIIALGLGYWVAAPNRPIKKDEDENDNEHLSSHGFWESWIISFKKGEPVEEPILYFFFLVAMVLYGGAMLLKTLLS